MYANAITTIENLDGLQQLEHLWLNENSISKIEVLIFVNFNNVSFLLSFKGLSGAKHLKELNLASNQIKSIGSLFFLSSVIHRIDYPFLGTSLAENTELEVLNLADNTISSFQVKLSLKKKTFIHLFLKGHNYINGVTKIT